MTDRYGNDYSRHHEQRRRGGGDWERREAWQGREDRTFGPERAWGRERREDFGRPGVHLDREPDWTAYSQDQYTGRYGPAWDEARPRDASQSRGERDYAQGRYPQSQARDYGRGRQGYDPYTSRFQGRWDYGGTEYHGADRDRRDRSEHRRDHEGNWWERTKEAVTGMFSDDDAAYERDYYAGERGANWGKGPKGYRRSDDRIREDVNDRLTEDRWLDASDIEVAVSECEVTLNGTVASRADKRRAEDCVERISGVKHVQNNLRVQQAGGDMAGVVATGARTTARGSTSGKVS